MKAYEILFAVGLLFLLAGIIPIVIDLTKMTIEAIKELKKNKYEDLPELLLIIGIIFILAGFIAAVITLKL